MFGKWSEGYVRTQDGDKFVHSGRDGMPLYEQRYEQIGDFHNGLAKAKLNGKWFHIDKTGKPAYEARFAGAGDFHNGYAQVWDGKHEFHIKPDGTVAYSERYEDVSDFNKKGIAVGLTSKECYAMKQDETERIKREEIPCDRYDSAVAKKEKGEKGGQTYTMERSEKVRVSYEGE